MKEAAAFNSGLGISYDLDDLLNIKGAPERRPEPTAAAPGKRMPDVLLQKPGTFEATRLHKITPNVARFYVAIFAGDNAATGGYLQSFIRALEPTSLNQSWLQFLIISKTEGPSAHELLGVNPSFTRVYYDKTGEAHERYGIDASKGAVFVFRPDGWIGTIMRLREEAVEELGVYFRRFMIF
jgi:phenol 2-monooxygenase